MAPMELPQYHRSQVSVLVLVWHTQPHIKKINYGFRGQRQTLGAQI